METTVQWLDRHFPLAGHGGLELTRYQLSTLLARARRKYRVFHPLPRDFGRRMKIALIRLGIERVSIAKVRLHPVWRISFPLDDGGAEISPCQIEAFIRTAAEGFGIALRRNDVSAQVVGRRMQIGVVAVQRLG